MENKYIEKVAEIIVRESALEKSAAPFGQLMRAARRTVKAFGSGVAKNSRSLVDDVKNLAKPGKKSRTFFAKSIARNPVAQAGTAAIAGAAVGSAMSKKKND